MISKLKAAIRRKLGRKAKFSSSGTEYYSADQAKNAGYQTYFLENIESIQAGIVPERYKFIASKTPGRSVIELGSADGTQALLLSLEKDRVCGVELMVKQFDTANELRATWQELGKNVDGCTFVNGGLEDFKNLLNDFDTVLMSRVLYHLRDEVDDVMQAISASSVKNVVLVGCANRTKRWEKRGETGDPMGKYAYFATIEGMQDILSRYGFTDLAAYPSQENIDPMVTGTR